MIPTNPTRTWPPDGAASRQDISTPFSILITFWALIIRIRFGIRYSICIRNVEDV